LIFNFLFFQFLKAKSYLFFFRALNSQHGSKLSSLGPFEAFFKLERVHAEIILYWSKSCFKKFLLTYMCFYNKTGQDCQGSGKMVRVKMSSAASSQITWRASIIHKSLQCKDFER
jgi:hypothetical protein